MLILLSANVSLHRATYEEENQEEVEEEQEEEEEEEEKEEQQQEEVEQEQEQEEQEEQEQEQEREKKKNKKKNNPTEASSSSNMKTTTTTAQTSSKDHPPSANSVSFNWNEFCDAVMELGQYFSKRDYFESLPDKSLPFRAFWNLCRNSLPIGKKNKSWSSYEQRIHFSYQYYVISTSWRGYL